mmetsp:Transcript_124598/g.347000  ORF Transcript_124598/g.347000 Transcript_124598/m.347000 type:complete len:480 (-) Transcript_124598:162-1601(-)
MGAQAWTILVAAFLLALPLVDACKSPDASSHPACTRKTPDTCSYAARREQGSSLIQSKATKQKAKLGEEAQEGPPGSHSERRPTVMPATAPAPAGAEGPPGSRAEGGVEAAAAASLPVGEAREAAAPAGPTPAAARVGLLPELWARARRAGPDARLQLPRREDALAWLQLPHKEDALALVESASLAWVVLSVLICGFGTCVVLWISAMLHSPPEKMASRCQEPASSQTLFCVHAAGRAGSSAAKSFLKEAAAKPRKDPTPPSTARAGAPDPVSQPGTSSSPESSRQPRSGFLCPELIVPEECECELLVPRLMPHTTAREVTVDDATRVPVFRVVYSTPYWGGQLPGDPSASPQWMEQDGGRCLELCSSEAAGSAFAFCRPGLNGALTILDSAAQPFGLIRAQAGQDSHEVCTRLGSQIRLECTERSNLAATDRRGRTLALTEEVPGDPSCRMVRIGPFTDAGLITLSIMAIDLLESTRS